MALTFVAAIMFCFISDIKKTVEYKGLFWSGVIALIMIINLMTAKFNLLPVIYFPSTSKIFGVIIEDREVLLKCLGYSSKLLLTGFMGGALVGIGAGIFYKIFKVGVPAAMPNIFIGIFNGT